MNEERKREMLEEILNEATENGYYLRAVNNIEDIKKDSIEILDAYMIELAGGIEEIENSLQVPYSIETIEDGIKIEYAGVNALRAYENWLQGQYDYIAVIDAEFQGYNLHQDGEIVKINRIIAVYDKTGNKIG